MGRGVLNIRPGYASMFNTPHELPEATMNAIPAPAPCIARSTYTATRDPLLEVTDRNGTTLRATRHTELDRVTVAVTPGLIRAAVVALNVEERLALAAFLLEGLPVWEDARAATVQGAVMVNGQPEGLSQTEAGEYAFSLVDALRGAGSL